MLIYNVTLTGGVAMMRTNYIDALALGYNKAIMMGFGNTALALADLLQTELIAAEYGKITHQSPCVGNMTLFPRDMRNKIRF